VMTYISQDNLLLLQQQTASFLCHLTYNLQPKYMPLFLQSLTNIALDSDSYGLID